MVYVEWMHGCLCGERILWGVDVGVLFLRMTIFQAVADYFHCVLYLMRSLCINAGWICYAEKTLGSYILPYISSVKSPQQTIGVTIKNYLCQKMGFR